MARPNAVQALVRLSLRRPRAVLAAWALAAALATLGVARLHVETSTDSVLSRADEAWRFYRESVATFGCDEIVAIAVAGERPWDPVALAEVVRLTRSLEGLPGVRRVDSLASVPLIESTPAGDLRLDAALAAGVPRTQVELESLARRVRADRVAPRSLVSEDETVFAVNVMLEDLGAGFDEGVVAGVRAAVAGHPAWISGGPVFRTEANARTRAQTLLFVPLTVALIAGFLFLVFRSPRAVVIPLATSLLGTWILLGAMGAAGTALTISTTILPSILLAIGCTYAMHVLAAAAGHEGAPLERALLSVASPVALSGLTTSIGFASMATVRIDAIRWVGIYGAFGALCVLAATLSVACALLRLWPLPEAPASARRQVARLRGVLVDWAGRRRVAVCGVWALALVTLGSGIPRLEVESDVILWFPHGSWVRDSYEEIRERLAGISPLNVVIESRNGTPVTAPDTLGAIDGLTAHLARLPDVGKVVSLTDPLRQIHRGFSGDPGAGLPSEPALVEQYLLLLESVEHLGDLVTDDRRAANVLIRADDNGSRDLRALAAEAEAWWREHGPPTFEARATGIMFEYARAQDEIADGQLRGLAVALGTIGCVLVVVLRSLPAALVALVANAVPIAIALGTLGFLRVPLDAGTVFVGSLALGIAVDETVHLMHAFHEGRAAGQPPLRALDGALERALAPALYTTLALGLGFGVLGLSDFSFTRNLGLATAASMGLCLAASLTLLPAFLRGR